MLVTHLHQGLHGSVPRSIQVLNEKGKKKKRLRKRKKTKERAKSKKEKRLRKEKMLRKDH